MVKSNDWTDYEVTAIEFFPTSVQGSDTSAWYGRGAKHTCDSTDSGSQGSAIKPDLWYAGNNRGWHVLNETLHFGDFNASNSSTIRNEGDGHSNVIFNQNVGNANGKWIGIKTVVYNQPKKDSSEGREYWPVMIETYFFNCDQDGNPDNNWELKFQCEDDPDKHGGEWSFLPNGYPSLKKYNLMGRSHHHLSNR